MKLINLYKQYLIQFHEKNISETSLKLLLCDFYNIDSFSSLILAYDDEVRDLTKREIKIINKVLNGYPVQYALKKTNFYNMDMKLNKKVLIPRPETEEVVAKCIETMLYVFDVNQELSYVDLGCGSGNILISIEKNCSFKFKSLYGIDLSISALLCAYSNIKKFESKAKLRRADMLKFLKNSKKKFNLITSNPPYISNKEEVDENVKKYEPNLALYIEPSYYYYEEIIKMLPNIVEDKFVVCFEIGYDLKPILEKIIKETNFKQDIEYNFYKDMYNNERILIINSK